MRFTEEIDQNVNPDFIPRRYFTPFTQVLPFYIVSLVLVIGSLQLQDWLGTMTASVLAFGVITLVCGVVFYRMQESNDLVMANDFQNLLFAGAASLGSAFCFFVRRDGTIVYANDGTRKMFPNFAYDQSQALDQLMTESRVSKEDANKLYSALTRGKKENLVLTITNAHGDAREFILIIEPLKRPAGYFVVHGRHFTSKREGKVKLPGILGQTSLEKIETLLDNLPLGVYLTNETGIIEYANPALEAMVRREARSIVAESLTIQSLVYHADGYETGQFDLVEFAGNVLLSCRNQSLSRAFLEQKSIQAVGGLGNGYLGILTPIG